MIAAIRQRVADFLRERRIAQLSADVTAYLKACDYVSARRLSAELRREVMARSPGQIDRMERRLGLVPRTALKRTLIEARGRGVLPAFIVSAAFRAFRLRGL